jgi:glycosyltransferase involved in cell wall biosynthesis
MTMTQPVGGKPLRILVVGTHDHVRQPSMSQFATWFAEALEPVARVTRTKAPSVTLRSGSGNGLSKWLAYVDQYVLLTLWLAVRHWGHDLVLVADHSNAPAASLVPRAKRVVMVHDTIAIRQARGEIAGAPPVGATGRLLQKLVLAGVRRASLLLMNPGPVDPELTALGVTAQRAMVGCPVDPKRLGESTPPANPPGGAFILNVSGDGWRKRKPDLLRLWAAAPDDHSLPPLVLVGFTNETTRAELARLDIPNRVRIYTNVSNGELAWFYAHCEALIVAGHEEGFCIPVAEASHFGKAVFGPASASLYPMIFGEAVVPIDLEDPERGAGQLAARLPFRANAELAAEVARTWSLARFDERVRAAVLAMPRSGDPA